MLDCVSQMADQLATEQEDQKKINLLFALRNELLTRAHENPVVQEAIFRDRSTIANLFATHGGMVHEKNVTLFADLASPDDLTSHTMLPKKKKHKEAPWNPGFYVFGSELTPEEVRDIRMHNPAGVAGKIGKAIPIFSIDTFIRINNDKKPIFIHAPLDEKMTKLLQAVLLHRPDFQDRLYHVSWETGAMVARRIHAEDQEHDTAESVALTVGTTDLSNLETHLAAQVCAALLHEPCVGEVYVGTITAVHPQVLIVEVLPGIKGIVRPGPSEERFRSVSDGYGSRVSVCEMVPSDAQFPDDGTFEEGMKVMVRVKKTEANVYAENSTSFLRYVQCMNADRRINRDRDIRELHLEFVMEADLADQKPMFVDAISMLKRLEHTPS